MATGDQHGARVTAHHYRWDASLEPCAVVRPGATVEFELRDPSDGQLGLDSTAADLLALDWDRVPPVHGPVFVEGAEPGDALLVTVLEARPGGWGWTANLPGFGLLADEFPEPALHLWRLGQGVQLDPADRAAASLSDGSAAEAAAPAAAGFAAGIVVPLKPFPGVVGLSPAAAGSHATVNPRNVGGNLDMRDLAAGATLVLPVEVPGALLSCGDGHAVQGDGEVCGTAIEVPMTLVVRLDVAKGAAPRSPRLLLSGPVTRHLDARGYDVTTGVGPDLREASRAAVREMIALLGAERGLSPVDAYMLCSVCADLRISEIVDEPDWVVSLYFPRAVFV
jgi:acetamidase/formamidase